MPITELSYGYKKPSTPTPATLWLPAMEENVQLMNDHNHDGVTGARIGDTVQDALAAGWSAVGSGTYRQLITCPTGFTYATARIEVRRSTGEMVYPTIEQVSANTFYLYTNDNTLEYKISYV